MKRRKIKILIYFSHSFFVASLLIEEGLGFLLKHVDLIKKLTTAKNLWLKDMVQLIVIYIDLELNSNSIA